MLYRNKKGELFIEVQQEKDTIADDPFIILRIDRFCFERFYGTGGKENRLEDGKKFEVLLCFREKGKK